MVYALAWFVMHIKSRFKNKIQESQPERGTSDLAETPPGKEVYGKRPQKETKAEPARPVTGSQEA